MDLHTNNDMEQIAETDRTHVWHHLLQHKPFETALPQIIVEGRGLRVWDDKGKEHIDAVSGGVWTVNVGYGRERIADAVRNQLVKMNYFVNTKGSVPGAIFAKMLTDKMPGMSRTYYSGSGSEANEKAFKIVRQISHKYYGGKKYKILYRDRDYHGSTIGCMSAGGHPQRNAHYGPFAPGFVQIPHCLEYRAQWECENYGERAADAIEEIILREGPDTVGALCLEPITAGGGIILPPKGYWEKIHEICKKYDILLHLDEVVCGVGRTGTWFGYQHFGIKPDIVTMAKGVASGYAAIACLVTNEKVFELFKDEPTDMMSYFRDISTFAGCNAGPAAAIENMHIIEEENLLQNCINMGDYLLKNLQDLSQKHKIIGDVRGKGLLAGIELVAHQIDKTPTPEHMVQAVVSECMAQGVIIGSTNRSLEGLNNTLLFAPALIVTKNDIDQIIETTDKALKKVFGDG